MHADGTAGQHVTIRLTRSEALVLSDAFVKWQIEDALSALVGDDPATNRVLFDLASALQPLVDNPLLGGDYADRLERARAEVLGE